MPATGDTLLQALAAYTPADEEESRALARIRDFAGRSPDALSRSNPEGHVTASAVVARGEPAQFLLVWHRKLGQWLQPGGHLEAEDRSVFAGALREAREETGIEAFACPIGEEILDVDVHAIPAHGPDPAHFHYDIRHLLTVSGWPPFLPDGCALFSLDQALASGADESLARALRKAARRLKIAD